MLTQRARILHIRFEDPIGHEFGLDPIVNVPRDEDEVIEGEGRIPQRISWVSGYQLLGPLVPCQPIVISELRYRNITAFKKALAVWPGIDLCRRTVDARNALYLARIVTNQHIP